MNLLHQERVKPSIMNKAVYNVNKQTAFINNITSPEHWHPLPPLTLLNKQTDYKIIVLYINLSADCLDVRNLAPDLFGACQISRLNAHINK